jgi:hypothetical protein
MVYTEEKEDTAPDADVEDIDIPKRYEVYASTTENRKSNLSQNTQA